MHEGWKINYDCEEYKLIKYKKQQHHHKTEAARECQTERGRQRREQEEGGIETVRKAQKHSTNATESQSGNGQTRNSTRAGPRPDGRQPRAANKQGGEGGEVREKEEQRWQLPESIRIVSSSWGIRLASNLFDVSIRVAIFSSLAAPSLSLHFPLPIPAALG